MTSTPKSFFDESEILNAEELHDLGELLNKKHTMFLNDRNFDVDQKIEDKILTVTVTLSAADKTYVYPVETRIDLDAEEMTPAKAALFLVDYIDLYFEDYLSEDEEIFIPIDWANYEYEAVSFQMRGQVINQRIEDLANQLLASDARLDVNTVMH